MEIGFLGWILRVIIFEAPIELLEGLKFIKMKELGYETEKDAVQVM